MIKNACDLESEKNPWKLTNLAKLIFKQKDNNIIPKFQDQYSYADVEKVKKNENQLTLLYGIYNFLLIFETDNRLSIHQQRYFATHFCKTVMHQ